MSKGTPNFRGIIQVCDVRACEVVRIKKACIAVETASIVHMQHY